MELDYRADPFTQRGAGFQPAQYCLRDISADLRVTVEVTLPVLAQCDEMRFDDVVLILG